MRNLLLSKRPASSPEQELWCGVLFQAVRDAARLHELEARQVRRGNSSETYHLQRDLTAARLAMRWLTQPSNDLSEVCSLAGIDEEAILDRRESFLAGRFGEFKPLIASHE